MASQFTLIARKDTPASKLLDEVATVLQASPLATVLSYSDDDIIVQCKDERDLAKIAALPGLEKIKDSDGKVINHAGLRGRVDLEVGKDVVDYSKYHHLCSETFSSSLTGAPEDWMTNLLTPEQVAFYEKNGYVSNVQVLTDEQCDTLLKDYSQFLDPSSRHPGHGLFHEFHDNQTGDPNNTLLHALGQWRITDHFHDLAFLPQITVAAAQLIGSDLGARSGTNAECRNGCVPIRLWHDQLFAKPPNHGGNVAWHQDYSYWTRTYPIAHLTVHIALDDQTAENGGLVFIPGSHAWKRGTDDAPEPLPLTDSDFADMDSIKSILTPSELDAFKPRAAGLRRGQASFHHPLTVHGSFANRSERPRRAAVLNYICGASDDRGVRSDTDKPLLEGVPAISKGQLLQGQFHPLVFHPNWLESGNKELCKDST